jgi:hypothetical protein
VAIEKEQSCKVNGFNNDDLILQNCTPSVPKKNLDILGFLRQISAQWKLPTTSIY